MDVLDKFLKQYSYKFDKGYPDMNNPKDKEMLFEFAYKLTNSKRVLNEQQSEYDDVIKKAVNGNIEPYNKLLEILSKPYQYRNGLDKFLRPPTQKFEECFQTYCGT